MAYPYQGNDPFPQGQQRGGFDNRAHAFDGRGPKLPSLIEDCRDILSRLSSLLGHVHAIGDKLNGGQPRPVEDNSKTGVLEGPPSVRRQMDAIRTLLGKIEDEIQTIDARL